MTAFLGKFRVQLNPSYVNHPFHMASWICHFRVRKTLSFKMRLSTKPSFWKRDFFPENKTSFSYQWLYTWPRLRNSPYFCVFKCAQTFKQNVLSGAEKGERDWKRCSAFARVKLLRNRLKKKPSVLQSILGLAEATRKWPILVIKNEEFKLTNSQAFLESRSKYLNERWSDESGIHQASVVQKVDSAIQRIHLYTAESAIGFPKTYPLQVDRKCTCLKIPPWFRVHFRAGGLCQSKGANYYEIGSVKIIFKGKKLSSGWRASLKNLKVMHRFCYL